MSMTEHIAALHDFLERAREAAGDGGRYKVYGGAMCVARGDPDDMRYVPLCNFTARIVSEEVHDDGAEQKRWFVIEGTRQDGKPLPSVVIPAERFPSMAWVIEHWGARAVVNAGQANKDNLRAAIQMLSGDVTEKIVFKHLGWRKMDGQWLYLHAGGAVRGGGSSTDVFVKLDGAMADYSLPDPPTGQELKHAVLASLAVLNLAPRTVTVPILSAVYRAPLSEALQANFSLFLAGPTGSQKTELTALAQAHFGAAFHGKHLPAAWSATANALERLAFLAKDAVLVVDDFAPRGTAAEVQRLHSEADRLMRAQGNHAGRGRLNPDGSPQPVYYPRGVIISSGEDVPRGHSLRARMWVVELSRGMVNLDLLTQAQANAAAGLYAQAMSSYLRWLAPQMDTLKKDLPQRHLQLRAEARRLQFAHDWTPDTQASLMIGWETFLRYAREVEAITAKEEAALWREGWQALSDAVAAQAEYQSSEDAVNRFLVLLEAAITSGSAHVADARTGLAPDEPGNWGWRQDRDEWKPQGDCIGWLSGEELWLQPDAAYRTAQKYARDQGENLPISQRQLWKRMNHKKLLLAPDAGHTTAKRRIMGRYQRVLCMLASLIYPGEHQENLGPSTPSKTGDTGDTREPVHSDAGLRPWNYPRYARENRERTQETGDTTVHQEGYPGFSETHPRFVPGTGEAKTQQPRGASPVFPKSPVLQGAPPSHLAANEDENEGELF